MKDRFNIYKSSFFYLLALFIIHALSTSLIETGAHSEFPIAILFTFIIIFCFVVIPHEKYLLTFTIILGFISITFHWIINFSINPGYYLHFCFYTVNIIFLAVITYSVLYTVTKHKEITADTLFGAITGYFLLGYTWSFIYLLISTINPEAFSNHLINASVHDREKYFTYFSFTTMTTLGYGDVLPISHLARTCSWLEAMTGQIYIAVWISQLVGLRIAQKNRSN